jgi:5-methylcytosine-specific restriction endonuclease McrA
MSRLLEIIKNCERTVVHTNCGAKISYYQNEIQSYVSHDYGGGSDTNYYIICSNCGKKVYVRVS